jgi:hypothetical protein
MDGHAPSIVATGRRASKARFVRHCRTRMRGDSIYSPERPRV